MCPGGEIVNASSAPEMLVINGMSYSQRSSPYSNAALAVTCHTSDYGSSKPLAGIDFQKKIESTSFCAGGSDWKAPAQNLMNFLGEGPEGSLNHNSYKMGVNQTDLRKIYPTFIIKELMNAFKKWKDDE